MSSPHSSARAGDLLEQVMHECAAMARFARRQHFCSSLSQRLQRALARFRLRFYAHNHPLRNSIVARLR